MPGEGGSRPRSQRQTMLLDRLRSLCTPTEGERNDESWQVVVTAVEDLVGEGVPPSSREVRGLLLPHIDELPVGDGLPPGFRFVLRGIDRYLATRAPRPSAATGPEPTAEVREGDRLLSGRSVMLIGGISRPYSG
jgi:hypothetical protein